MRLFHIPASPPGICQPKGMYTRADLHVRLREASVEGISDLHTNFKGNLDVSSRRKTLNVIVRPY